MDLKDPLKMNLGRQTRSLLERLGTNSQLASHIQSAATTRELLDALSQLLVTPAFTLLVAREFRPVLFDLCARWLLVDGRTDEILIALCLLLEAHPELFPILQAFLTKTYGPRGPLRFLEETASPTDQPRLHFFLLSYYRILQANRRLPYHLSWPIHTLAKIFTTPNIDPGSKLLAIRCYFLQSGMGEAERIKLEQRYVGDVSTVECSISYSVNTDGSTYTLDGWVLPAVEATRTADFWKLASEDIPDYYHETEAMVESFSGSDLSPLTVNVSGIFLLRDRLSPSPPSGLVQTDSVKAALRELALLHSLRHPTLLTSSPSSGKSLLIHHLSGLLHPCSENNVVTIHLADTSLDPRSLLGFHVSSTTEPGTFEWKEGVLVKAMKQGKWVVLKDIDRGSTDVLGVIKPLVESLGPGNWIGGRGVLPVPGHEVATAHDSFAIFATRSVSSKGGKHPKPIFFGSHKFAEVIVPSPSQAEVQWIVNHKFPRLTGRTCQAVTKLWEDMCTTANNFPSLGRGIGIRELERFSSRINWLAPVPRDEMEVDDAEGGALLSTIFTHVNHKEEIFLYARDVFFGAGVLTASARQFVDQAASVAGHHLGLSAEHQAVTLHSRVPEFDIERDINGQSTAIRLDRTRLLADPGAGILQTTSRPFAMHKPAVRLMGRLATSISLGEPILLTGETGTGKTSAVTHLATLLRKPLISLNLSQQTESSDILGGLKPIDARVPGMELYQSFMRLFGVTLSSKKNAKFQESVRKAVREAKWKRAVALWVEAVKIAKEKLRTKAVDESRGYQLGANQQGPRKRQRVEEASESVSEADWNKFEQELQTFDIQHVRGKGKFAFAFVEGPLIKALRSGDWILFDEINLASAETLECISSLLQSDASSITLTEQGSLEPIPRHSDFRIFACMNPATDVGKKDLPANIRSRFLEIDVQSPDTDRETLLTIIEKYIGRYAIGDKVAIMDIADFYTAVKTLSDQRKIADGENRRPHYSMRTLVRWLIWSSDATSSFGLRRALWEGCLMAFTMTLDSPSTEALIVLARRHLLANVKNTGSFLTRQPVPPLDPDGFVKVGPFYLNKGPIPPHPTGEYIVTPSVEKKLVDLARIIVGRRFPVLIEGPTSTGKTSSIEYLAKRTGHRFVRINNHEHTDIQEYIGTYVSDPSTGKLVFQDGLLVRALRRGDWIVLDELNLAPTDVLEALNRLLDDNRELVIPETQEVVRPHPNFLLFATQNPPGLYGGRKVLSRAFRNRFLEAYFDDLPQEELETILCQRCRIAPSYAQRIVRVFRELTKRRQSTRVFEAKHGFATLRDLFRWAGRDAVGYQQLAENGYMLLAERVRRAEDKAVVKEVIEAEMNVQIDENNLYGLQLSDEAFRVFLSTDLPTTPIVWTNSMRRLYSLVLRALQSNEPVLLVGETGCGKTSACQMYADAKSRALYSVNCHQNTETADLIGALRPVRNRAALEAEATQEAVKILANLGVDHVPSDAQGIQKAIVSAQKFVSLTPASNRMLQDALLKFRKLSAMFEWHDGPLIQAMTDGGVFLLDEISLADDSVLERLNSVLEPSRMMVLAERGGESADTVSITSTDGFQIVATMNPGGDYGKKELSPAMRNRFTEIWVPSIDQRQDLERIANGTWNYDELRLFTQQLLDFVEWIAIQACDRSLITLRDILAWITFSNAVHEQGTLSTSAIFHQAACMTYVDGIGAFPQFSSFTLDSLRRLKESAMKELQRLVPLENPSIVELSLRYDGGAVHIGPFSVLKGDAPTIQPSFNFGAPTTLSNAMRVMRACQLNKPILLEGSPGVGKTSLVTALASVASQTLSRINLSDQTDLIDLFGSDLPIEGGAPGQFAWKDAEFLRALQEGHWVLLDEMNLAPQAVLEGLNSVLDHRGMVYIPELGRSFQKHPSFRIFAAQNPPNQGGGRKGLPKSFVNRFTKVYVEELCPKDQLSISQHLFPDYPIDWLEGMIRFTSRLNEEVVHKKAFAHEGGPWEFNLRDLIRWGSLLKGNNRLAHPSEYLHTLYLHRFRTSDDRERVTRIFSESLPIQPTFDAPRPSISPAYLQIGTHLSIRKNLSPHQTHPPLLPSHLTYLETIARCSSKGWLVILTGPRSSGKSSILRVLSNLSGNLLQDITINPTTDTADILGSFEQVDINLRMGELRRKFDTFIDDLTRCTDFIETRILAPPSHQGIWTDSHQDSLTLLERFVSGLPALRSTTLGQARTDLLSRIRSTSLLLGSHGRFEWVDGPLIRALKEGHWVALDGANLCSPSVLDRLNSLCESNGVLVLNERGSVGGGAEVVQPHPNFRLFMIVDPQYGELSRAMRNRGVEVALLGPLPRSLNSTQNLTNAQAFRLGLTATPPDLVGSDSDARIITQDSICSTLLSQLISSSASTDSLKEVAYFIARTTPSAFLPYAIRYWRCPVLFNQPNSLPTVQPALQSLRDGPLSTLLSQLRYRIGRKWNIPSDFLPFQPQVVTLNSLPCFAFETEDADNKSHTTQVISLLNLLVELQAGKITTRGGDIPATALASNRSQIVDEVLTLVNVAAEAARKILNVQPAVDSIAVTIAVRLLRFGKYLSGFVLGKEIDYSALRVVVRWINEVLDAAPQNFETVAVQAKKLEGLVYLSSGWGFYDIWNTFLTDIAPTDARPLEMFRRVTSFSGNTDLRNQAFQFAALCTLPTTLSHDEARIVQDLKEKFQSLLLPSPYSPSPATSTSAFWLAQLNVLRTVGYDGSSEPPRWYPQHLLNLFIQDGTQPLRDALALQQLLWASLSSQPRVPYAVRAQTQWLENAWRESGAARDEYALDLPIATRNAVTVCDPSGADLSQVTEYTSTVDARLKLTLSNLEIHTPRNTSLAGVLMQAIIMLLSSFRAKSQNLPGTLQTLSSRADLGTPESVGDLLDVIRAAQFIDLEQSHMMILVEALTRFRSHGTFLQEIGLAWVAFSKFVISAYVPNIPIDPLAAQVCTLKFWKAAEEQTQAQLNLHMHHEKRLSGNPSNVVIHLLEAQLLDIQERLAVISTGRRWTRETDRLGAYWAEVSKFVSQVFLTFNDYLAPPADPVPREFFQRGEMFQDSLSGFCHRLETVYPEYHDISMPMVWAILHMKLGVRLASTQPRSNPRLVALSEALMSVPSILGTTSVIDTTTNQPDGSTSLHLGLSAIAIEISSGVDRWSLSLQIIKAYDHLVGRWLVEREKEEATRASATSLYRVRKLPSNEEEEEAEFLSLFPDFSDHSGGDDAPKQPPPPGIPSPLTPSGTEFLQIHRTIVSSVPGANLPPSQGLSRDYFAGLLRENLSQLTHSLDDTGTPYQSLLLKDRLDWLRRPGGKGQFYHGSNLREISRVTPIVLSLRDRLSQIIAEWPDQMVLQRLRNTCDMVLALPLTCPLPRVLASLERLLLQTDDWEMYANRDNTLSQFRQKLIELIVDWRRLELACWKSLLETERLNFVSGVADWWFQLYETLIRGSYAAAEQSLSDDSAFSQYMDSVVPLVDQFIHTSPLGQFPARIQLLHDFEHHLLILSKQGGVSEHMDFERTARILHHTRNHYHQFSATIERCFSRERATQEGAIQGFIKLASWRDINVRTLQQSARKTHHQLYKSIRKFRETLRQPVSDLFRVAGPSDPERKPASLEDNPVLTDGELEFPIPSFPEVPAWHAKTKRLSGISNTFARFDRLLSRDLRGFIMNSSPKHIDQLAVELILVSEGLSRETVPSLLPKEKRQKDLKALLVRKKKAFSDYLKELKRSGLSSNVKLEVLSRNQNQRWVREQPILSCPAHWTGWSIKGEDYFYRVISLLPVVRLAAGKHHQAITSHEYQRAVGLLESAFSNALASRSSLSGTLDKMGVLRKFVHRLQGISRDQHILTCGGQAEPALRSTKDSCYRLKSALSEVKDAVSLLQETASWGDFHIVMATLEPTSMTAANIAQEVHQVYDQVTSTTPPVFLRGEHSALSSAISQTEGISTTLKNLARDHTFIYYFVSPVWNWIDAIQWPHFDLTDSRSGSDTIATQVGSTIDTMLIDVQEVLKTAASNGPSEDQITKDRFLTRGLSQVMKCTQSLNLNTINTHLQQLLVTFSTAPRDEVSDAVGYVLPFLERYLVFVDTQLINHHYWTNALFKLTYISCSIVQRICNDGFCQPPAEEEEEEGEGKESADGVGMGEGTGKENVSEEIKEESQVEGLQDVGEEGDIEREKDGDDNAIEMGQDIGGELEDIESQDEGEDDESGGEQELEDKAEDLDANDPHAVDEKLWGDEQGKEPKESDDKLEEDHSSRQQQGDPEVVAKENEAKRKEGGDGEDQAEIAESDIPEAAPEADEEEPGAQGAQIEDRIDEKETLDLPEDLQMGDDDDMQKEDQGDDEEMDDSEERGPEEGGMEQEPFQEDVPMSEEAIQENDEVETSQGGQLEVTDTGDPDSNQNPDLTNPDLYGGADQDYDGMAKPSADTNKDEQTGEDDSRTREGQTGENDEEQLGRDAERDEQGEGGKNNDTGTNVIGLQSQVQLTNNPLRRLGDALREVRRNLDQILESSRAPEPTSLPSVLHEASQFQYSHPEDQDQDMEALGTAGEEEAAHLNDLTLLDEAQLAAHTVPMEVDDAGTEGREDRGPLSELRPPQRTQTEAGVDGGLTRDQIADVRDTIAGEQPSADDVPRNRTPPPDGQVSADVEVEFRSWQANDYPSEGAQNMWRLYESLTHDLSYSLCEQLRSILEPTQATRLKGDYRTGKRLNMKKVIPYIASEYTKDKIWLRRTKPSQREYQVLIALDDSRSMAESHSIHLAYQTLALVSRALARLEVGDVGIAKFGQTVEVLHGFDNESGPFNDQAGVKVLNAFRFNQKATDLLGLVETSLEVLERARDRRSTRSASTADLWQLEIIISDGVCQDMEKIKTVLRKAEEQRVMIVFVILDSLHSHVEVGAPSANAVQNSILKMQQGVVRKNANGVMEVKMERYLDLFPFEYYVVIRDVEALPEILSGTLKQFFERISED